MDRYSHKETRHSGYISQLISGTDNPPTDALSYLAVVALLSPASFGLVTMVTDQLFLYCLDVSSP